MYKYTVVPALSVEQKHWLSCSIISLGLNDRINVVNIRSLWVNYDGIKFIGEGRCPVNHQSSSQQRWQFSLFISSRHGSNNFWHEIQCHVRHRASISNSQVLQLPNGSKIQDAQLRLWGHGYFLKSNRCTVRSGYRRMKPRPYKVSAACSENSPTGYQSLRSAGEVRSNATVNPSLIPPTTS